MYSGEKLGEAIKEAMRLKNVTQSQVAHEFGVKQPSVAGWTKTGRIAKDHIDKLIEYFSDVVPPSHFGIESLVSRPIEANARPAPPLRFWSSRDPLPEEDYTFVPFLKDFAFIGGAGCEEGSDYNGFQLPFGKATLRRMGVMAENVFCCTLEGDSMEPRIPDGATIAVDKGRTAIKDGDIYAFVQGGLYRVKYLYKMPGGKVRLRSQNEEEHPEETASLEDIQIVGRVFWVSILFY